jgi:hypothetical protein
VLARSPDAAETQVRLVSHAGIEAEHLERALEALAWPSMVAA